MKKKNLKEAGLKNSSGGGFDGLRRRSVFVAVGILIIMLFALPPAQAQTFVAQRNTLYYDNLDGGGGGTDHEVYDTSGTWVGFLYLDGGGGGTDIFYYKGGGGGTDHNVYDANGAWIGTLYLDGGGGGTDGELHPNR